MHDYCLLNSNKLYELFRDQAGQVNVLDATTVWDRLDWAPVRYAIVQKGDDGVDKNDGGMLLHAHG